MTQLLQSSSTRKKPRMMTQAPNGRIQNGHDNEIESDASSGSESGSESESEEDSEDEDEDDEDEDDPNSSSAPAQAGVIEKLSLKNFMCHDSFELELGPQLNFIIGRNGSGKSAVLTGISVGLGAKATDTNRGSSIKDLIKDGKSVSRITIVFKNEGPDAYKPNVYGNKIIVERKLQRQGGNSYSLKTSNGKTVSHKKSDLDEMLYKFSITVDNPLAFLSQDKAREFLTSSSDKDKYEFFMDGAFITDILNNYSESANSVQELEGKIQNAAAIAQKAKKEYKAIVKIHNRHRTNDALRNRLQVLSAKIHWFNVVSIERVIKRKEKEVAILQQKVQEFQNQLEECDANTTALLPKRESLVEELHQEEAKLTEKSTELDTLRAKRSELKSELDVNKAETQKNIGEIKNLENEIKNTEKLIRIEQRKIDELQGGSRETLNENLENVKKEINETENRRTQLKLQYNQLKDRRDPEVIALTREYDDSNSRLKDLDQQKSALQMESSSQYAPWGNKMHELVRAIKSRTDWNSEPIGPAGSYVQVKSEFTEWKPLLSTVLGKSLDAFIVTNESDRYRLDQMLKRYGVRANIFVRRTERLNYEAGKADPSCKSVLDMLHVQSDTVLYTLIDSNSIEKTVISHSTKDAREACKKRNVFQSLVLFRKDSGHRISFQNNTFRQDPVYYATTMAKFGAASKASLIADLQRQIDEENTNFKDLDRKLRGLKMKSEAKKEHLILQMREITETLERLKRARSDLEDQLDKEVDYSRISSWQTRIEENKNQIARLTALNESLIENLKTIDEKRSSTNEKIAECKEGYKSIDAVRAKIKRKLINVEYEIEKIKETKNNILYDRTNMKEQIKAAEAVCKDGHEKLASAITAAEEYCSRDEVTISPQDTLESITRDFQETSHELEKAEQEIGSSLEEVLVQVEKAKQESDKAEEVLAMVTSTARNLSSEMNIRLRFLNTTIRSSIGDAQRTFEKAMQLRGFQGTLKFDFNEKTLKLQVNTGNESGKRTVESLSGGEKSFSQISLLLSIWKVMNSRIRGLDEFDVYMDSVNRSISIKLLLKELKRYPKSQNIFITPQDIAVVGELDDKGVKIHRMTDPRKD